MRDEWVERLAEALRRCRVDDGAPVALFSEGDVQHIAWMLAPVVDGIVAEAWDGNAEQLRMAVEDTRERTLRDVAAELRRRHDEASARAVENCVWWLTRGGER